VRPPTNDADEEPDVVTFGIAALDGHLEHAEVTFPATRRELDQRLGGTEIPYDAAGHSIGFSRALEQTTVEEFETQQELLNALHPVFEEQRAATSNSLLAQLRALLPF